MAHTHDVYDTGKYFEINEISRFIKETSPTKLVLVQGDHKSEVITFKMPRYIDGHDMLSCNKIRVHYINIDTKTNDASADIYEVTDLALCEDSEDMLTFTWVVEAQATKYAGTLSFLIKFECTEGENIHYQWNTAKYVGTNVLAGIDNSEEFVEKYSSVLNEWYNELTSGADSIREMNEQSIAGIEVARENAKKAIDDKTQEALMYFSENARVLQGYKIIDLYAGALEWRPTSSQVYVQYTFDESNTDNIAWCTAKEVKILSFGVFHTINDNEHISGDISEQYYSMDKDFCVVLNNSGQEDNPKWEIACDMWKSINDPDIIQYVYFKMTIAYAVAIDNDNSVSDEQIAEAVNEYLEEHPVQSGATAEQAQQITKNKDDISKLQEEKVDNPSTAEVGQVLEVESVDENGKPTSWKTVDKSLDEIVDLAKLGVKEGSEYAESNTAILQKLVETYPTGEKTFYLDKGTYYFNPIDFTPISGSVVVRLKGKEYGLINNPYKATLTSIITNKQDFMYDKRNPSKGVYFIVECIDFYSYKGYGEIPTGVCFGAENNGGSEHNFCFYNVLIHGFDYGFKSPGYSCGGSGGKNVRFSTCHYGVYIANASHGFYIENLELTYNRVGIRLSHGGHPCGIKTAHVATGYLGADREDFDEYIVFHTKGSTIIDGVYFEAYDSSALSERTVLFDFEGYAYGCGGLMIKNTPIERPGGIGSIYLRAKGYLGYGPETGIKGNKVADAGSRFSHYPTGLVKLENCNIEKYFASKNLQSLLDIIDVYQYIGANLTIGIDLGHDIYEDNNIITKDYRFKLNSYHYGGSEQTAITYDDENYLIYKYNGFFKESTNGFNSTILTNTFPFRQVWGGYADVKGYLEITEDFTDENINIIYGMINKQIIDSVEYYYFYPITPLNANVKKGSTVPFDLSIKNNPNASINDLYFGIKLLDTTNNADGLNSENIVNVKMHADFHVHL